MKKIYKIVLPIFVAFVVMISMTNVSAKTNGIEIQTEYETMLEIAAGHHLRGSTRSYKAGHPCLAMNVNRLYEYNGQNYSNLAVQMTSSSGKNVVNGSVAIPASMIGVTFQLAPDTWDAVPAGNYNWYIAAKVEGVTYSGVYIKPLYLQTVLWT